MDEMNTAEIAVQEAKRAILYEAVIEIQNCKTVEEAIEKLKLMAKAQ